MLLRQRYIVSSFCLAFVTLTACARLPVQEQLASSLLGKTQHYAVAFSPGNANQLILSAIQQAQASIDIAAYSFTSKDITNALIEAYNRGVKIRVVADKKGNNNQYTSTRFLANYSIAVRLDSRYAIMHNKFMIIDDKTVQTGSFNYTAAAAKRNAENVLIIQDKTLSQQYYQEFERLWRESEPLVPTYE